MAYRFLLWILEDFSLLFLFSTKGTLFPHHKFFWVLLWLFRIGSWTPNQVELFSPHPPPSFSPIKYHKVWEIISLVPDKVHQCPYNHSIRHGPSGKLLQEIGDQSLKWCSGFPEDHVPISWKKNTQQRGGDSDINNCWGSLPGEGRALAGLWLSAWGGTLPACAGGGGGFFAPLSSRGCFCLPRLSQTRRRRNWKPNTYKWGAEGRGGAHHYRALVEGAESALDWSGLLFLFLFRLEIVPLNFCASSTFVN